MSDRMSCPRRCGGVAWRCAKNTSREAPMEVKATRRAEEASTAHRLRRLPLVQQRRASPPPKAPPRSTEARHRRRTRQQTDRCRPRDPLARRQDASATSWRSSHQRASQAHGLSQADIAAAALRTAAHRISKPSTASPKKAASRKPMSHPRSGPQDRLGRLDPGSSAVPQRAPSTLPRPGMRSRWTRRVLLNPARHRRNRLNLLRRAADFLPGRTSAH